MTPEQLEEIKKLAEAATPGPWSIDMHADVVADTVLEPAIPDDIEAGGLWPKRVAGFPYTHEGSHQRKDAAFIVAMREHALPLVKALREARAEAERLRDVVQKVHGLASGSIVHSVSLHAIHKITKGMEE